MVAAGECCCCCASLAYVSVSLLSLRAVAELLLAFWLLKQDLALQFVGVHVYSSSCQLAGMGDVHSG